MRVNGRGAQPVDPSGPGQERWGKGRRQVTRWGREKHKCRESTRKEGIQGLMATKQNIR